MPFLLASIHPTSVGEITVSLMIVASTTKVDNVISRQEDFVDQWSEKWLGLEVEGLPLAISKIGAGE